MNEHDFEAALSGARTDLVARVMRPLLWLLSRVYGVGRALHRFVYRVGILRSVRLPRPVLSVGNLSAGGVGKTPFVGWLAARLLERGVRPVVLARGYGRAKGAALNEEGEWLRLQVPGLVVLQDPDRARRAREFLAGDDCDLFVLDDGFQHERLVRDLQLVLVDATRPFGHGFLLPRGLLRDPPSALRRADFVLLTRTEQVGAEARAALIEAVGRLAPGVPVGQVRLEVGRIRRDGEELPVEWLRGRNAVLCCGVGHPASVERTLTEHGARIVARRFFPDHHRYAAAELRDLESLCDREEAELVVTSKDEIKLQPLSGPASSPRVELLQEVCFAAGEAEFWELLRQRGHVREGSPA